jgi:hypothetical protein
MTISWMNDKIIDTPHSSERRKQTLNAVQVKLLYQRRIFRQPLRSMFFPALRKQRLRAVQQFGEFLYIGMHMTPNEAVEKVF